MPLTTILIANRGEIAIRIARAAAGLGLRSVAVYAEDDARSLHVRRADAAHALPGSGPASYLNIASMIAAAHATGCDAVHPGYGFLSENPDFERACLAAGLVFIGPDARTLALFGDKAQARALAETCGVPVAAGTARATSLAEARAFLGGLGAQGAVMVKAVSGGGGRGMRVVRTTDALDDAYARCQSEALAAFGNGDVYVERFVPDARHIEVQIVGDGTGLVTHLWERECTLQRRHQKLVEVAPSPSLDPTLRERIIAAAVRMAEAVGYRSLGTFEFLVDGGGTGADRAFVFIEANPRLQVEHTVTEAVTGIDLVQTQLRIAAGATLPDLGLTQAAIPRPDGYAIQLRVNLETMRPDGQAIPSGGLIAVYEPPSGPGIRVDGFAYAGYTTSPRYDSLLAKLIVHTRGRYDAALAAAARALGEFRIDGVATNAGFLQALLQHPDVVGDDIHTGFVEAHAAALSARAAEPRRSAFFEPPAAPVAAVGADATDGHGPPGSVAVRAPMAGSIVSVAVQPGDAVQAGAVTAVIEAMKVELLVKAETTGYVRAIAVAPGALVALDQPILFIEPATLDCDTGDAAAVEADASRIRPDLAEILQRRAALLDAARPDAVERRHRLGHRTARENIADLCEPGSFDEYGGLLLPMQRGRKPLDELIARSPADGLVAGVGLVNGSRFGRQEASCAVLSYDYTVFAGTQGFMAHRKTDRMFEVAAQLRLPVIVFTEGGGGRPGDTDYMGVSGLELRSFTLFAQLSGLVPLIGITAGRCFAGNAALLGCCDVVIATRDSTIGMAGPAMIEGGGLGRYTPEEVGPVSVQAPNGVIDIVVEDEAAAVVAAKAYLSYFQGPVSDWDCADQMQLRHLIPDNRRRVYDIRDIIAVIADSGSVLELRARFGVGMITALARIEGRPVGIIANNPVHLGGAVDAPGADKAARFMQLCGAFDIPILTLCDTPGFMVGPKSERTATVRHFARMFVTGANVAVPIFAVILRKAYGLGAQAMFGGNLHMPVLTLAWPTGEFGPMGLEGYVRLAYRRELEAIADPAARQARYEALVAALYEHGTALNAASFAELDDVIDPADTRQRIAAGLRSLKRPEPRPGKKRPMVDSW